MKDLRGKVVVITGGGSGIGRATSLQLGREGATVAVADLRKDSAEQTVADIVAAGGQASAHGVDVTSDTEFEALRDAVLEQHGVVDVVINNAGIAVETIPTVDTSLEIFRKVLDVNLWGVIHGTKTFLPHLLSRPSANLVNTCSFAGLMGMTEMSPYNVSKFGVRGLTEALQMEFNKSSLTVTLVCPGGTRTPLMTNSPTVAEANKKALTDNLMKSKSAKPPEYVAACIVAGIKKDKHRVLAGPDTVVIDKIVRLLPGSYPRIMAPQLKKLLDKTLNN
ncbi:MAG TPA: SDR family oxidoreductase [Pseudonocardia sp.]|nr:SDR family oxidoreductase [Pseudonocardia sp.]